MPMPSVSAARTHRRAKSLEEGLAEAKRLAGDDAVIVAAGSLYFAGSLRTALGLAWR